MEFAATIMMTNIMDIKEESWSQENTPSLMARSMFYYLQSAGHFYSGLDYSTDRKDYNTFLLLYTISGRGCLKYRGESYQLTAGKGFLINCMEHQYYGTEGEGPWEMKWVHFNGSESKSYFQRIYENSGPIFSLDEDSIIPVNVEKIQRMLKRGEARLDIMATSLIVQILTELLLKSSQGEQKDFGLPDPVKEVLVKIENSYYKPLDLETLVSDIGVSKYHLSRQFKKHTGYSPYEYLVNYRLNQAKQMLKCEDLPVYEIADRVGFNSTSHFIKIFKQHEATTPLQFRKYWR